METDASTVLESLVESRDFDGIAAHCESALLQSCARAGGGHPEFAAHVLSLLAAGRLHAARFAAAQRARLPPRPALPCDAAAARVVAAVVARDMAGAQHELSTYAWQAVPVCKLAVLVAEALREDALKRCGVAYAVATPEALADALALPEEDACEAARKLGWTRVDDGMGWRPPREARSQHLGAPAERVARLADQLVRLQTSG